MLTKYVLESVKTNKDLIDLFRSEKTDLLLFINKAIQLEYFMECATIIAEQAVSGITYTEMVHVVVELEKSSEIFVENEAFENVLDAIIGVKFDKPYENYQILKRVASFIVLQRGFKSSGLKLNYLKKLRPMVNEMLLLINIDAKIAKLENNAMSRKHFEFIEKCLQVKQIDSEYKTFVYRLFKEIMPGLNIQKIEQIEEEMTFNNSDKIDVPDKKTWEEFFDKECVDLTPENIEFVVKYDVTHNVVDDKIVLEPFNNVGFSTKVFDIIKLYQEEKVSKIGAAIHQESEDESEESKVEEVPEQPSQPSKNNQFRHMYNERKRFFRTHVLQRKDLEFIQRQQNYTQMTCARQNELENKKQIFSANNKTIEIVLKKLEDKLETQRLEQLRIRAEKEKIERERREKEEEGKRWYSKSHQPKFSTAFSRKEPEIKRENFTTDEEFEKHKKLTEMYNSINNSTEIDGRPKESYYSKNKVRQNKQNNSFIDNDIQKRAQEAFNKLNEGAEPTNSLVSNKKEKDKPFNKKWGNNSTHPFK